MLLLLPAATALLLYFKPQSSLLPYGTVPGCQEMCQCCCCCCCCCWESTALAAYLMVRSLVVNRCVNVAAVDAGSAPVSSLGCHHCVVGSTRQRGVLHYCVAADFDLVVQLVACNVVLKEGPKSGDGLPGNNPAKIFEVQGLGVTADVSHRVIASAEWRQLQHHAAPSCGFQLQFKCCCSAAM
jgi:hypothetical protein